MKRLYSILMLILGFQYALGSAAVTYTFSGGRFGDQLLAYAHARWVAYKCNIPMVYIPFDNADKLRVNTIHNSVDMNFDKEITFPKYGKKAKLDSIINPALNNLYVIQYFPESPGPRSPYKRWHFEVDWEDKEFFEILKHELSPVVPISSLDLPKDRISVAVHMRRGGGHAKDRLLQDEEVRNPEADYADVRLPLKFPPFEYYVEQIVKISELVDNQPIYAHIFTDDRDPEGLLEKCKAAVNKPNILFGSRDGDKSSHTTVLDDFFALTQFDCLIRGDSNFSLMASKLAKYRIQISPANHRWEGTKLIITDSYITQKKLKK